MSTTAYILTGSGLALAILWVASEQARHNPPKIHYKKRLFGGYNARTMPPFGIYISEEKRQNMALLEHELKHWQQFQEMGLFSFYWNYFRQLATGGYDRMPMEVAARANESEYCRFNYTECVRNGQANTIYNPQFRT